MVPVTLEEDSYYLKFSLDSAACNKSFLNKNLSVVDHRENLRVTLSTGLSCCALNRLLSLAFSLLIC